MFMLLCIVLAACYVSWLVWGLYLWGCDSFDFVEFSLLHVLCALYVLFSLFVCWLCTWFLALDDSICFACLV